MSCSSYSGDPASSPKDTARFLIGDTTEGAFLFTDQEIEFIVNQAGENPLRLEYLLYSHMVNYYAKQATHRKLGPQSETYADRLSYFRNKLSAIETKLHAGSGLSGSKNSSPRFFWRNQHRNPPSPPPGKNKRWWC